MSGCNCSTAGPTNGLRGCHPFLVAWSLLLIACGAGNTRCVRIAEKLHAHLCYTLVYISMFICSHICTLFYCMHICMCKSFYGSTAKFYAFVALKWSCVGLEPKVSASVFVIFYSQSYLLSSALLVNLTNIFLPLLYVQHITNTSQLKFHQTQRKLFYCCSCVESLLGILINFMKLYLLLYVFVTTEIECVQCVTTAWWMLGSRIMFINFLKANSR